MYYPDTISAGELAAVADADPDGWIIPPLYNSLRPSPPRQWRTVHLRYLQRRGMIGESYYRRDNMWCVRLNAAGLAHRPAPTSFIFATGEADFIPAEHSNRRFMVLS